MRRHLSFANVVSTMALFIDLGGGAYAAVKLPRNSVGEAQIKAGAVRSGEVKDGTLRAKDFKRGDLPPGAAGRPGATGPTGSSGLAGVAGPGGAVGPSGPRGPSAAFQDSSIGQVTAALNPGIAQVRQVNVPAGTFVATAVGEVQNTSGAKQIVRCGISSLGTDVDTAVSVPHNDTLPITVTGGATLASAGTISFDCRRFGGLPVTVGRATLTVVQVASLNGA